MAKSIIGAQASIGPSLPMPMMLAPKPHWKTATIAPKAAPIESMFMITALSGTTTLWKTTSSSRNESTSTAPMKSGSRSPM